MTRELGRYRLLERVAAGGMGEVHRGVDVGWGGVERPVAVKLIAPALAKHPDFVRSFTDEARLSFLLCHRNVVQVRDIGQADDTYFIAMEWVEGADVGTLLTKMEAARQPLPMRFAVLIAAEAARGLDYAHRLTDASGAPLHLVHRDVSPTNLLVSVEGDVKVTDFGIARWRFREAVSIPGTRVMKGKIGYMAPEQARGEEVDARADVWSVGVVLYEMLTGVNPFDEGTEAEVLRRLRAGEYLPPSRVHALPAALEAIVLRAMAPARADRYATCAALGEDLEAYARRESWALSPTHLGAFVRGLLADVAFATTEPQPAVLRAKTPTPPKPFDLALGAQLAALQGAAPAADDEEPSVTQRGKRVMPPRTVALHPVIAAPSPVDEPKPLLSDTTDLVPRTRPGGLAIALAAVALIVVAGGAFLLLRPAPAPPEPVQGNAAPLPPITPAQRPAPPIAPPGAAPPPAAVVDPPPRHDGHVVRPHPQPKPAVTPATLDVVTTAAAEVYVDDRFRGTGPQSVELKPGTHRVRVEGSANGLRLVPKETTVELKMGDHRNLRLEPQ